MKKSNIIGVIFPLPDKLILRIFEFRKNIFTKFTTHSPSEESIKIRSGNTLFLYKSRADKTVVGEATIGNMYFMLPTEVMKKYKDKLITPSEEMPKYVRGRDTKKMLVLELINIRRYSKPIVVKIPVTMAGQYVTEENQHGIFGEESR